MQDLAVRATATATALHRLLARAEEDKTKGSSSGSSSKSGSKTSSGSKATSSSSADNGASTWIYRNTDLVISICICAIVFTLVCLCFIWWYLKRRHRKKEKAEAALGQANGVPVDFEDKAEAALPNVQQQELDYSTYPHFNAAKPPPPVQVSFDDDASIIDEKPPPQQPLRQEHRQTGGGYSLGAISERSEEQEHMDEGMYGRPRSDYGEQAAEDQQQLRNRMSDPRDSYYYNERQAPPTGRGGAPEDRDSVHSVAEQTRYV